MYDNPDSFLYRFGLDCFRMIKSFLALVPFDLKSLSDKRKFALQCFFYCLFLYFKYKYLYGVSELGGHSTSKASCVFL